MLAIIAILTVVATLFMDIRSIIQSDKERPSIGIYWTTSNYWTNDKQFIRAMYEIGSLVPKDEVLLVSLPSIQIMYFAQHKTLFPKNISSQESLLNFMTRNNYSYLLIFNDLESKYNKWLSNDKDLDKLSSDYHSLANYTTDKFNVHLLERKLPAV